MVVVGYCSTAIALPINEFIKVPILLTMSIYFIADGEIRHSLYSFTSYSFVDLLSCEAPCLIKVSFDILR